jgi:hypothetical protein
MMPADIFHARTGRPMPANERRIFSPSSEFHFSGETEHEFFALDVVPPLTN